MLSEMADLSINRHDQCTRLSVRRQWTNIEQNGSSSLSPHRYDIMATDVVIAVGIGRAKGLGTTGKTPDGHSSSQSGQTGFGGVYSRLREVYSLLSQQYSD